MERLRQAAVRLERGSNMERLRRWGNGQKSTRLAKTRQVQISLKLSTIFNRTRRTTSAPWVTAGVGMCQAISQVSRRRAWLQRGQRPAKWNAARPNPDIWLLHQT